VQLLVDNRSGFTTLFSVLIIHSLFHRSHTVFSVIRKWILYRVSQEEMSIFWEVIVSVILSKKVYIYTSVLLRTVSEIEIFHCTVAKLLIKRYYVLFLISVFIVQVKKIGTKVDTRDELLNLLMDVITNIKERQDALRRSTRYIFTRVAKWIDVDGGIFGNVLY